LAVAIRTPAGMVVHTGDFKMDQLPLDNRLTDNRPSRHRHVRIRSFRCGPPDNGGSPYGRSGMHSCASDC
ncbi:hypothetical protein, partial [Streptomyces griseoaurantiacus]|uniref:hypothetical protein n=1 Tax=Streptomyces griseoaurantiacus TaxID=68213 RepID=UPI00345F8A5F